MGLSYHYVHKNSNIYEANPLLPKKPSAAEFILHKGMLVPTIAQNSEAGNIRFLNIVLTLVVIRNHHIFNTSPTCINGPGGANYHVDGYNINCI